MTEINTPFGVAKFSPLFQEAPNTEEVEKMLSAGEGGRALSGPFAPEDKAVKVEELQKALLLEKIYNSIYGTQIEVLRYLRKNINGIFYVALSNVYEQWKEKDEVLKNYQFQDYVCYLLETRLVRVVEADSDRSLIITPDGVDFLSYIEKAQYKDKDH